MSDPTGRVPTVTVSSQQFVLAVLVLSLMASVVGILAFVEIPKENQTVFNVVVGAIGGFVAGALAFYFPSSVGARAKDEAISKLTDQLPAKPPEKP